MTTRYTYVIFNNGREVENLDAGTYPTEAAAEFAGLVALNGLCPPFSPNRRYYRVESAMVDPATTDDTPQQITHADADLLAERDKLRAEVEQLRGSLLDVRDTINSDHPSDWSDAVIHRVLEVCALAEGGAA